MKWFLGFFLLLIVNSVYAASVIEEYRAAEAFLSRQKEENRPFIKFLAYSEVPATPIIQVPSTTGIQVQVPLNDCVYYSLSFTVHSLSSKNIKAIPRRVPDSPEMFYIDIRNYGWTVEAWEQVSLLDPYYREPWITYEMNEEDYARYQLYRKNYGNFIVKAVWFIINTTDTMKQVDFDIKDPLYYTLLYAGRTIPSNVNEFRAAWGVDKAFEEEAKKFNLINGRLVDHGASGVARHNRVLARVRTLFGSFNETSDVKNNTGKRDLLENQEPNTLAHSARDASEIISHNPVGLQVHFLANAKGERVDFADPGVAWDRSEREDIRIKTARSCMMCHAIGLNPSIDGMRELLKEGKVELYSYDKDFQLALEQFYTTEYGLFLKDDNELFARTMKRINGLEPAQNSFIFRTLTKWYELPVNIEQAALDCGLEVEDFKKKVQPSISGRLGSLFNKDGKIPRETWDAVNGGAFGNAMLLAYSMPETRKIIENIQKDAKLTITKDCDMMVGTEKIGQLKGGTVYNIMEEKDGWFKIQDKSKTGWVYKENIKIE